MRFLVCVDVPDGVKVPMSADELADLCHGISDGQVKGAVRVDSDPNLLERVEAIGAFLDCDDDTVLSLIDRLMADDWTGTGVYEALNAALTKAEDADLIHDPVE